MKLDRHPIVIDAQRVELWRRYKAAVETAGDGQCFCPSPRTLISEHVGTEVFVHKRYTIQNQRSEKKYKSSLICQQKLALTAFHIGD